MCRHMYDTKLDGDNIFLEKEKFSMMFRYELFSSKPYVA